MLGPWLGEGDSGKREMKKKKERRKAQKRKEGAREREGENEAGQVWGGDTLPDVLGACFHVASNPVRED